MNGLKLTADGLFTLHSIHSIALHFIVLHTARRQVGILQLAADDDVVTATSLEKYCTTEKQRRLVTYYTDTAQ